MDQVIVSSSNRTPVVQIVTWFCLVTSVLAFAAHAGIKLYTSRKLTLETLLNFSSLTFAIAQSIVVSVQTANGYGKASSSLSQHQLHTSLKSGYAATILFVISLGLSKITIVAFIHGLTPKRQDRVLNYILGAFSILWTLLAVLIIAFQCKLPRPWDLPAEKCISRLATWYALTILNIVSEIAIVTLETTIIIPLQVQRSKKISMISLFMCRLLVPIIAAVQLHLFRQDSRGELQHDYTLGYWRSAICIQVLQCLAIVTTSLPYAKLFMESFESGMIRVDDLQRRGQHTTGYGSGNSYRLIDISRSGKQNSDSTTGITKTVELNQSTNRSPL